MPYLVSQETYMNRYIMRHGVIQICKAATIYTKPIWQSCILSMPASLDSWETTEQRYGKPFSNTKLMLKCWCCPQTFSRTIQHLKHGDVYQKTWTELQWQNRETHEIFVHVILAKWGGCTVVNCSRRWCFCSVFVALVILRATPLQF